jgi:ankyrin repeat protein
MNRKDEDVESSVPAVVRGCQLAESGNVEGLRAWIAAVSDVDCRDDEAYTVLHHAAEAGQLECLDALLAAGANPNARSQGGYTPIFLAALLQDGEAVIERLIRGGADVNQAADDGDTVLHNLSANEGNYNIFRFILQHGANPNARRTCGETPLQMAAVWGVTECVRDLLAEGADTEVADRGGGTALTLTAAQTEEHLEITELLLEYGADPDHAEVTGYTALHFAAQGGHARIVAKLLSCVKNVNPVDSRGKTPLQLALEAGHEEIVAALRAAGARESES